MSVLSTENFRISHLLDEDTMKILMCSFVLSRLDYCNAILKSCPKFVIQKLQKVQNRAAKLVFKSHYRDSVTPLLKELHWLPVSLRIDFKILCYAYKCFHHTAPFYLQEIVKSYTPQRTLRSKESSL